MPKAVHGRLDSSRFSKQRLNESGAAPVVIIVYEARDYTEGRTYFTKPVAVRAGFPLRPREDSCPLSATKRTCLRWPSGVHSPNSICATSSRLTHTQVFISSSVNAHCVRLRS